MEVTDGFSKAPVCVYIRIDPPNALVGTDYNYTIPLNDPFTTGDGLCSDVTSPTGAPITVDAGLTSTPLATEGVVTLGANCSWSFDPKDGWFGERLR